MARRSSKRQKHDILCSRLREARKGLGITQRQLAAAAGIAYGTYTKYEGGSSVPTVTQLLKIALFLNVSMDFLVGLTPDRSPQTSRPRAPHGEHA